ncbi:LysR family transcriptional regulator [Vibrio mediterranei]|uniref:LysR family transcriptional regulator n=2 Tax=Vibrio mediterranei TaxID=689 RepID=A0ABX5DG48_9VIBR|nr:LysR family transcriptional regulator [Vibrio mediterranei]PRQ68629.1 LysR family transcriptional regulator [Vibrio mediterranei]
MLLSPEVGCYYSQRLVYHITLLSNVMVFIGEIFRESGMDYSLAQLQAFVATVEAGSFKAAAIKLGKSSQVVARLVGMMEDSCSVLLFERQIRQLQLTEEGKKLYRYAKRIILDSEKLNAQLASFDQQLPNSFTVAIDNYLSSEPITQCYLDVLSEFPSIDLVVKSGDTSQVIDWITSGQAEVALVFSPLSQIEDVQEMVAFNFPTTEVASSRLVSAGAVLTQEEQNDMTQIVPQFVYDFGHEKRYILSDNTISCTGFDEVLSMLKAGAGWARIPNFKASKLIDEGVLNEFYTEGSTPVSWHAMLYYPNENQLSIAADVFIERVMHLTEIIE